MDRLQSELARLFLPRSAATGARAAHDAATHALLDAQGRTRTMVLAIAARAGWEAISRVWRGCQAELGLPAPAIAVSGTEAFQLWFSLAEPLAPAEARGFLELLCAHFLAEVDPRHLQLLPAPDPSSPGGVTHAALIPAESAQRGHWSAFVAPDLAPLFSEAPWLDIPPGIDGQADLLCRMASIGPEELAAAAAQLRPTEDARPGAGTQTAPEAATSTTPEVSAGSEARAFLLRVMRDESVALALRIEAARALLRHTCGGPVEPPRTFLC